MKLLRSFALSALIFTAACQPAVENETASQNAQAPQADPRELARERQRQQMRDQARNEMGEVRFVVDKSDRKVIVYQGGEVARTHDVAVGAPQWDTPTGEWAFHRVDLNPEWIPPDSEWSEDEQRQPPGDPDNPMGRARLVFNMPYTIHGTDDLASLGKAVSHGSIRVANENVIPLAELLLRAGGAWEGRQWFDNMIQNRGREFQINLPQTIPIVVQE